MHPVDIKEKRSFVVILIVPGLVITGTVFYGIVEDWGLVDALYFSVITLTTIGYGDLAPTTYASKLFTICYVVSGVAMFGVFVREIAHRAIDTVSSPVVGVRLVANGKSLARRFNLPTERGLIVLSVSRSGTLSRSGVRGGDVITFINETPVYKASQVFDGVANSVFGRPTELTVCRKDGIHTVVLKEG